jgi:GAF domain-containing protein
MAESFEVNNVLYHLGDSAVEILKADGAGVSIATKDDRLAFVTATDRSLVELEEVQESSQRGPSVDAFRSGEPVVISDIAAEIDWVEYRAAAAFSDFGAVVGMPLVVGGQRAGSLNIYARGRRDWSDEEVEAVRTLADIATAYVVRAGQLAEALDLAGQLQRALDSRVIIEQAKGVLSRDRSVPIGEAFDLLRTYSRSNNRSLREVAHEVVNDGLVID